MSAKARVFLLALVLASVLGHGLVLTWDDIDHSPLNTFDVPVGTEFTLALRIANGHEDTAVNVTVQLEAYNATHFTQVASREYPDGNWSTVSPTVVSLGNVTNGTARYAEFKLNTTSATTSQARQFRAAVYENGTEVTYGVFFYATVSESQELQNYYRRILTVNSMWLPRDEGRVRLTFPTGIVKEHIEVRNATNDPVTIQVSDWDGDTATVTWDLGNLAVKRNEVYYLYYHKPNKFSVSYITDYQHYTDRSECQNISIGFNNSILDDSYDEWVLEVNYTENYVQESTFADESNFRFHVGHGNKRPFIDGGCTWSSGWVAEWDEDSDIWDEQKEVAAADFSSPTLKWGDGVSGGSDEYEWVGLWSCYTLYCDDNSSATMDNWGKTMNGLHLILGFKTDTKAINGIGELFGDKVVSDNMTLWDAWCETCKEKINVAGIYARVIAETNDNLNDHISERHGYVSWDPVPDTVKVIDECECYMG